MKPIWFSLFDFYTAAERRGGERGRGGRSGSTHYHRRSSSDRLTRAGRHNPVTLGVTPRLHHDYTTRQYLICYNIAPKTPGRVTEFPYCQSHRRRRNASWPPLRTLKRVATGSDDTRFFARMRGPAPHRCRTDALISTCRRCCCFKSCTKLYGIILYGSGSGGTVTRGTDCRCGTISFCSFRNTPRTEKRTVAGSPVVWTRWHRHRRHRVSNTARVTGVTLLRARLNSHALFHVVLFLSLYYNIVYNDIYVCTHCALFVYRVARITLF